MGKETSILDVLNQLIEEIILFDGENPDEFNHLRELISSLEESLPDEERETLMESLEEISRSEDATYIDQAITAFQESVGSLRNYYLELEQQEDADVEDHTADDAVDDSDVGHSSLTESPDLVGGFLREATEYLNSAEEDLLGLEEAQERTDRIDGIFRSFHTIKGVASFLEFRKIHRFAHGYENLLESTRSGTLAIHEGVTDHILAGIDALRTMLKFVERSLEEGEWIPDDVDEEPYLQEIDRLLNEDQSSEQPEVPQGEWGSDGPEEDVVCEKEETLPPEDSMPEYLEDPELVRDFLEEAGEHLQSVEQHLILWEDEPENSEHVDTIFRGFHTIKGVAGFLNLQDIQHTSHEFENLLDEVRSGERELSRQLIDLILRGVDGLRAMTGALEESLARGEHVPHDVDLDALLNLEASMGESQDETQRSSGVNGKPSEGGPDREPQSEKAEADPKPSGKASKSRDTGGAIRVETEKMDYLIDMVGELVITQNMVSQNELVRESGDKRLQGDMAQLKRITSTLQNIAMSLRMIPIGATFRRMKRIVRDLSRKSGKDIRLQLSGEQTEIDRNMVEELYDPLVHMIRNSCDHGIESPERRKAAGKSEHGTIYLNAYHEGGNVVIEVSDDGAGLDRGAILAKATERGMVQPDEELKDKEVFDLILQPGFSTAKSVTDVSGRGVGMDVVRRTIENMRGQVEISSNPGEGTTFHIKLPLTLAIIDGVIVGVGKERYVLPTLSVEQSVQPQQSDYNFIAGRGETIRIRDELFPLIRLHQIFDVETNVISPWEGIIVLAHTGEKRVALLVDALVDKQEIVIKSMGEQLQSLPGVSGGAILGDGTVGLILDIPGLSVIRDARTADHNGGGEGGPAPQDLQTETDNETRKQNA